ncbi:amidohydrolase [Rheinheimera riviphila]|uniref:Amidohydrolase n=1 Tax=Rheinheimera riviphila TaxID=1834037 RepID=A0A437R1Y9_9GAMM|nr:amidohydrolase family protein [Rheinheimera riviphila]RVU40768.1 amidohydrolase [Rheinheimera riviphila]
MAIQFSRPVALLFTALSCAASAQSVLLENITLVDVKSLQLKAGQTVVLDGDSISAVYKTGSKKRPADSTVLDMGGLYLLPGLIDAHVHHATEPEGGDNAAATQQRLSALLRGGVTTVRDMGGDVRVLTGLKRQAELDLIQSPDMYYSVIIGGPEFFSDPRTVASARGKTPGDTDWMRSVNAQTDFDALMLRTLGTGATGIKIYAKVPADLMPKLAAAAKKHGVKVWAHAYVGPANPADAVQAGVEVISHAPDLAATVISSYENWRRKDLPVSEAVKKASFDPANYLPLLQQMKQHGTMLDATLTIFHQLQKRNLNAATIYQHGVLLTKLAHQQGIKIVAGTDYLSDKAGLDYPMVHQEMQLLVEQAGLTPIEAIQAATLHGAEAIGIADKVGSIDIGKKANLLILSADPTENISNSRQISHVIKNGRFVYRGDDQRLPFSSARAVNGVLYLSGQLGNFPGTMVLNGQTIESQMHQTMLNISAVLQEHQLGFDAVFKCTLMLADINEWPAANKVYIQYFKAPLPARSAFAASGLALGAKVEVECMAQL